MSRMGSKKKMILEEARDHLNDILEKSEDEVELRHEYELDEDSHWESGAWDL